MQLVKRPVENIVSTIENPALFTLSYLRCGTCGGRVSFTFVSDTDGIQRALIDWSEVVALFRRSRFRLMSGEVLATPKQLRQMGFEVSAEMFVEKPKPIERIVKLPRIWELGYCVDVRRGNYIVTLPKTKWSRRQQLILSAGAFLHVFPATNRRSAGGTQYASVAQLELLGFHVAPVKTVFNDTAVAVIA